MCEKQRIEVSSVVLRHFILSEITFAFTNFAYTSNHWRRAYTPTYAVLTVSGLCTNMAGLGRLAVVPEIKETW